MNCSYLLSGFAVQEWLEVFVNKFFDYTGFFCESNKLIFFLISESCNKHVCSQISYIKNVFNAIVLNGFQS